MQIMKLTCCRTLIPFAVTGVPITLHANAGIYHPIFDLPTRKLLGVLPRWQRGDLDSNEEKLLFLAILSSTGLVEWRTPALITSDIAAKYMIKVSSLADKLNTIPNTKAAFPRYVIEEDNNKLGDIQYYISALDRCWQGLRTVLRDDAKKDREGALEACLSRLMAKNAKNPTKYAAMLANWVSSAAQFPNSLVILPNGDKITCNEHWMNVIKACGKKDSAFYDVDPYDIDAILTYLEQQAQDNIFELGTVHSKAIFTLLETALDKRDAFFGINLDAPYLIIEGTSEEIDESVEDADGNITVTKRTIHHAAKITTEQAKIATMVASAPTVLPRKQDYPSAVDYYRAKACYDTAQRVLTATQGNNPTTGTTTYELDTNMDSL